MLCWLNNNKVCEKKYSICFLLQRNIYNRVWSPSQIILCLFMLFYQGGYGATWTHPLSHEALLFTQLWFFYFQDNLISRFPHAVHHRRWQFQVIFNFKNTLSCTYNNHNLNYMQVTFMLKYFSIVPNFLSQLFYA